MANTTASQVYDAFMMRVTDYRLTTLFQTSEFDFETYLGGWLAFSIVEFSICDQPLVFDNNTRTFSVELNQRNILVLAMLMEKQWMNKCVQDVTQFALHITDRDFKVASEAMNLKEKSGHLNVVKEQCSQLLNDYAYSKINWSEWYTQTFTGA